MRSLFHLILIPLFFFSISYAQDTIKDDRFSIHAQTTVVNQFKPAFSAKYSGPNSLSNKKENQVSLTTTLFAGMRLWKGASVFINPEMAGGSGLSGAMGIASATNGETFRVGDLAPQVYLARLFYRQIFSLTSKRAYQPMDLNQLGEYIPEKYFALTVGKIGVADYFDDNKFSHDPRSQFLSWGLMDNGAWDYPANTRGYTPSVVLEYVTPKNELRYSFSLVATTANGSKMNGRVGKANSSTLEYTRRYKLGDQEGAIRVLGFFTTTDMGNYRQSIAKKPFLPDIEDTRKYGRTKFGFGINVEQNITNEIGCFLRAGWNDGINETWAFTEIDHTLSLGFSMSGEKFKRPNDNIGIANVVSGLSKAHREYLKLGGNGFMLGDGNLSYSLENLSEVYYSFALYKTYLFMTGTYQLVLNPGYNADRKGPVNIFSVRFHAQI